MIDAMTRHSEAEALAAFVDGRLEGNELAAVTEHLATCEECRMLIGEAAAFGRETSTDVQTRAGTKKWWLFAAAAAIALILGVPWMREAVRRHEEQNALEQLAESAPRARTIEPRLTGFAWTQISPPHRGP